MKWIKVEDQLPPNAASCLIMNSYGEMYVALPDIHEIYDKDECYTYSPCCGCNTTQVTHWMPLPEPPSD